MQNLRPERLHGRASLVSGKHKPLYMMEGLDEIVRRGLPGQLPRLDLGADRDPLAHLQPVGRLPRRAQRARGRRVRHQRARRAPLRRADRADHRRRRHGRGDAAVRAAGCECVVVKRSITRFAAESLHPEVACERIREGAARALDRIGQMSAARDRAAGDARGAADDVRLRRARHLAARHRAHGPAQPAHRPTTSRCASTRRGSTLIALTRAHPGAGVTSERVALVTGAARRHRLGHRGAPRARRASASPAATARRPTPSARPPRSRARAGFGCDLRSEHAVARAARRRDRASSALPGCSSTPPACSSSTR